jgi:hypothetical protein
MHMLCLYDTLEQVTFWQEDVYAHLPKFMVMARVVATAAAAR